MLMLKWMMANEVVIFQESPLLASKRILSTSSISGSNSVKCIDFVQISPIKSAMGRLRSHFKLELLIMSKVSSKLLPWYQYRRRLLPSRSKQRQSTKQEERSIHDINFSIKQLLNLHLHSSHRMMDIQLQLL